MLDDLPLVECHREATALSYWRALADVHTSAPSTAVAARQRSWDKAIITATQDTINSCLPEPREQARLLAVRSRGASAWLNALPITSLGLRLSDEDVRVAAGLRLGTRLCHPHACRCGVHVDDRGIHGLSCAQSAGRHVRHSLINKIIHSVLVASNLPSALEPRGMLRSDDKRPDGLSLVPWNAGRCLVWDATILDTLAASHVGACSRRVAAAATKASKRVKYEGIANSHTFIPVALETFGSYGEAARRFVVELGRLWALATDDPLAAAKLRQRLSVAIQRGNAICVKGT